MPEEEEVIIIPELTYEQKYLAEWKSNNKFSYLLNGDVFVKHEEEI